MKGSERRVAFEQRLTKNSMLFKVLDRMPQPVIASVRGGAAGAGLGFVLAADIVIAAKDAKFVLAHVKVGASPDAACSYYLPRSIGAKRAKTMALLGDDIDASTALDWGLLDFTCEPHDLEAETQRLTQRLAAGPATSLAACKSLMNASFRHSLEEQLAMEAVVLGRCAATDDFLEGPRAYLEKRKPRFAG